MILKLNTESVSITYNIPAGECEKFFNNIRDFINEKLQETFLNSNPLIITDSIKQNYILIKDCDITRQFSAKKELNH